MKKKQEAEKYDYDIEESKFGYAASRPANAYQKELDPDYQPDAVSEEEKEDEQIKYLSKKVELLEQKLKSRDLEIKRVKIQNQRLLKENKIIIGKLKKKMTEEQDLEEERRLNAFEDDSQNYDENEGAEHASDDQESNSNPQMRNPNEIHKHLLQMLMQAQAMDVDNMREMEEQREKEMIEKAIQESLKENPNPDVMNYEQLQELEEKIGSVSKGFSDIEISIIPSQVCVSTKDDCSICLDGIEKGQWVKTLSCDHVFHKGCIDQCFKTTKKCPCCMKEHQISS